MFKRYRITNAPRPPPPPSHPFRRAQMGPAMGNPSPIRMHGPPSMRPRFPEQTQREIKNLAARTGVSPTTAAHAAMRVGLQLVTIEDVEEQADPEGAAERRRARKAKEALSDLPLSDV